MIVVSGRFRLPVGRIDEALPAMDRVIAAPLAEPGCREYSYAEDITEPGLFRVYEEWESPEALEADFATRHMCEWQAVRETLGFSDRTVTSYEVMGEVPL